METAKEQNKYFWNLVFLIRKDKESGKIKMDYALYEINKLSEGTYQSSVSKEMIYFKDKSFEIKKKKDFVFFRTLIEDQSNDFKLVAEKYLPIMSKFLRKRIPFRFKFKKKLSERIPEILYSLSLE